MKPHKQGGILMITVALMLAVLGALAFVMTREGGTVASRGDLTRDGAVAAYLARAGFVQQQWSADNAGCSGYQPVSSDKLPGGTFSTTITPTSGKLVTITSTGLATLGTSAVPTGGRATRSRSNVTIHQVAMPVQAMPFYPGGGDTFVYGPNNVQAQRNFSGDDVLYVAKTTNGRALLRFDLTSIPVNSTIVKATLQLSRYRGDAYTYGTVSVHPVTTNWTYNGVTWNTPGTGGSWSTPGGDFAGYDASIPPTASVLSGENTHLWDLQPELVDRWVNQAANFPNYGVILNAETNTGDFTFVSSIGAIAAADKPILTVSYHPPCP
ncbi:MAG: hypothetical protein NVSMB6_14770 [Burkholderiaceae bacterium]